MPFKGTAKYTGNLSMGKKTYFGLQVPRHSTLPDNGMVPTLWYDLPRTEGVREIVKDHLHIIKLKKYVEEEMFRVPPNVTLSHTTYYLQPSLGCEPRGTQLDSRTRLPRDSLLIHVAIP